MGNVFHIRTNKHVIRTTRDQEEQEKAFFGEVDGEIEAIEKDFSDEKKTLSNLKDEIEGLKRLFENEKDTSRKRRYEDEYAHRYKVYQNAKRDYEKRHRQFKSKKRAYLFGRSDYKYRKAVSNLSRSFEIVLADNTQLNVRLVATSGDQDLALLKLDGYKVPAIKISNGMGLVPGWPVYAIGNPAKPTPMV